GLERAPVLHVAGDLRSGDRDVANVARIDVSEQLAERDLARRRLLARALEQRYKRQDQEENDHPQGEVAVVRVHRLSVTETRPRNLKPWRSGPLSPFKRGLGNCQEKDRVLSIRSEVLNCSLLAARHLSSLDSAQRSRRRPALDLNLVGCVGNLDYRGDGF